jgi:hypothetical protein
MFEDPNGLPYIGTPAWKTKNYYAKTVRMEHGEVGKQFDEEASPERNVSAPQTLEKA